MPHTDLSGKVRTAVLAAATARGAAIAALLCASPALGWAQGTPAAVPPNSTPAAVLPNIQRLEPTVPRPLTNAAQLPGVPDGPGASAGRAPRELGRSADELRLDVKAYAVEGGPPALQAALPALTAAYIGPGRSYEDLERAALEVTRYLQRELGYYLGHAYLPEQVPRDGVVRIAVLEGRLDHVVLNWPEGLVVDRAAVQAHLDRLKPGNILLVSEVERVVFLINDLRGIQARFEFDEGAAWGTANLIVNVRAEDRWQQRLEFDSDGSRYSGEFRLGAQATLNSPLGRGDALTLSAQTSTTGGLGFGLLGYTSPVGASGLKLGASLSAIRYRLDKSLLPQDVSGQALAASVYALYPLLRSRNLNLFSLASLEAKRFLDRQGDPDSIEVIKRSEELRIALTGDFRDGWLTGGVNTFDFSANAGSVRFLKNPPAASDDARQFRKIGYGFTRLQNLVSNRLLVYLNLRGQQALSNLDATQQFRLGGSDGVRAFAPGEMPGDSGQLLTAELRWLPLENWLPFENLLARDSWLRASVRDMVFSLFYDHGQVRFRHDVSQRAASFVNGASLAGAGIGVAWERPHSFNLRIYLAQPTGGEATGDPVKRNPRVYALVSKTL